MATSDLPLHLCTSGVAGLVGGGEAVSALVAVHVYESRQWFGWYNSPGSYQIAKRLGLLAKSRIPNASYPGVLTDLTKLLKLDITKGPKFSAIYSGTVIEDTGHVGSLVMKECADREGKAIGERKTEVIGVTVVQLNHIPDTRMHPIHIHPYTPIRASIPIATSLASCVACGVFWDWWAFSLILLGILANGVSSWVIGSGTLQFEHPDAAKGSPLGNGILVSGKEIVLLKGEEGAVNSITRGRFSLKFTETWFGRIGWCSVFFNIQFIVQLLLIPQASPIGQILFSASLGVSWLYNYWLSSNKDKDKIQRDMLFNSVLKKPDLTKHSLGTFTSAVVFSLLVLQPKEPEKFLDGLLPNNTKVWKQWKKTIVQQFRDEKRFEFSDSNSQLGGLGEEEEILLQKLCKDAQEASDGYDTMTISNSSPMPDDPV